MRVGMKIGSAFAGALIILFIVGWSSYYSVGKLIQTNQWVSHTQDILEQLSKLIYEATEVQTSARGYLITGQKQYLEINTNAAEHGKSTLTALKGLTKDNSDQLKEIDALEDGFRGLVSFYSRSITTYDANGYEPAANMIRSGGGQKLMNQIRDLVGDFIADEKKELADRMADATKSAGDTKMTIAAGTLLAVAFVSLFGYLISRSITKPINRLVRASDNLGRGRFDAISVVNTNDEFEDLTVVFNQLGITLQETLESVESEKQERIKVEKMLEALRERVEKLALESNNLLAVAEHRSYKTEELNAETINSAELSLTSSVQTLSDLSKSTLDVFGKTERDQERVAKLHSALSAQLKLLDKTMQASANGFGSLSEQIVELSQLIGIMEGIATELTVITLSTEQTSHAGNDDDSKRLLGQLQAMVPRVQQEAIKVRQILSRTDALVSRTIITNEESALGLDRVQSLDGQLEQEIASLRDAVGATEQALKNITEGAHLHTKKHDEISNRLDRLSLAVQGQENVLNLSALKAKEVNEIALSASSMLNV